MGLTTTGFSQLNSSSGTLLIGDGSNAAQPIQYTSSNVTASLVGSGTTVASSGSIATGDYVVIGTWANTSSVSGSSTVNAGLTAFAAAVPSPTSALSSLSGQRASYSFQNATPVFSQLAGPGSLLSSSKLNVDFTAVGAYVDVNLDVSMPTSALLKLRGGVTAEGMGFKGKLEVSGSPCLSGSSTALCSPASVTGSFSGTNAERALLTFGGYSLTNGHFGAAATFSKTAQAASPSSSSLTDLRINLTDGSAIVPNTTYASALPTSFVTSFFVGEKLVKLEEFSGSTQTLQNSNISTGSHGALGVISDTGFLGWGNWVAGSKVVSTTSSTTTTLALDAVHYVVGRPTSNLQMPLTGTANYSLVGGTAPTAILSGATQTGQLINASLSANFASTGGSVTANIDTLFGTIPVNISQLALITPGAANFSGSTTSSASSISGFFTGDKAYRAGLVFSATNSTLGQVRGAAVFQRSN